MPDGEGRADRFEAVRRQPVDELVVVKWRNLMMKTRVLGAISAGQTGSVAAGDLRTSVGSMKLCVADQACGVMRLYKGNCCCGL